MNNYDFGAEVEAFERRLRELKSKADRYLGELKSDVASIRERDPAARTDAEVLLLYPGLHAVMAHRVANKLYRQEKYFAARAVSQWARNITGIEIHPAATIGKGLFIDHGCAVVIGETTIIGDNCTIYQGATLGGTGKETGKRHPTLGDNVMVGAGAKLLGNFTVGSGAKIAAGAVELKDVPENCTAVGIPAHIVRKDGEKPSARPSFELDQVHIPDPVENEIREIIRRIDALEDVLDGTKE